MHDQRRVGLVLERGQGAGPLGAGAGALLSVVAHVASLAHCVLIVSAVAAPAARRHAGPALERTTERALIREPEQERDLAQSHLPIL